MKKLIAITIGDIDGIGIDLLIKEWKKKNINNFVIFTNIFYLNKILSKYTIKINIIKNEKYLNSYNENKLNIFNLNSKSKYSNSLESLKKAYDLTSKNYFIGILTLPINKKEINKFVNKNFIDQTSFFSNLENNKYSNMVFSYKNKFFVPLTTHIELKDVHKYFKKKDSIINKIFNLNKTIIDDFKIIKPKILLAGINPHAGEKGLISQNDDKYLKPIIEKLKRTKIDIDGPISGDAMISEKNLKKYNVFLFTYHDQALIPFKMISKFKGINYTSGLKVIRVSPSHGTGRDIIGTKFASAQGILNSFKTIKKIYKNRINN